MMFDQARFHSKFNKLCSYIEDQMRELRDAVVPGSTPAPRMFVPLGDVLSQQCASEKHGEVLTNLVVGSQPSAVGKSTSGKLGSKSDPYRPPYHINACDVILRDRLVLSEAIF